MGRENEMRWRRGEASHKKTEGLGLAWAIYQDCGKERRKEEKEKRRGKETSNGNSYILFSFFKKHEEPVLLELLHNRKIII